MAHLRRKRPERRVITASAVPRWDEAPRLRTATPMIVSRTPLRISFVGGGTDLPEFADKYGGAVVSTSIDKWIHVVVAPRFERDIRVSYSRTEIVPTARDLEH